MYQYHFIVCSRLALGRLTLILNIKFYGILLEWLKLDSFAEFSWVTEFWGHCTGFLCRHTFGLGRRGVDAFCGLCRYLQVAAKFLKVFKR